MKSWFALSTPAAEFKAESGLRELATKIDGMEVYCPRERFFVWSKGRRRPKCAPWLPGYVFTGLHPTDHDARGEPAYPFDRLLNIDGVCGVVGIRGVPIQIPWEAPDPEYQRRYRGRDFDPGLGLGDIKAMEEAGEFDRTSRHGSEPKKGDPVQIVGGPFQGYPAKFEAMSGEERVRVVFQMMGRWLPLPLKRSEVTFGDEQLNAA